MTSRSPEAGECWIVRDETGAVCGLVDYERPDTAAQFEVYENGDGGVSFEGRVSYTVSLGYWGGSS